MNSFRRHPLAFAVLLAAAPAIVPIVVQAQTTQEAPAANAPAPAPARRAAPAPARNTQATPQANAALRPCTTVTVDPPLSLALGKSRVIRLDAPASRIIVGGRSSSRAGRAVEMDEPTAGRPRPPGAPAEAPAGAGASDGVADTEITLLSPTELFFLGRRPGSMNVILQGSDGRCVVKDIVVTVDPDTLQGKLTELMPNERGIKVSGADTGLVLTGSVRDASALDQVLALAGAYTDPKRIVNLMRVSSPQQVMLEVKIAEVSKALLDRFGLDYSRVVSSGSRTSFISGIIGGGSAALGTFHPNSASSILGTAGVSVTGGSGSASALTNVATRGSSLLGIDTENRDGIVRVLAEPNIMAISGQSASFLSGGKIFIPVAQSRGDGGGTTITLEEKEFGVGLKFTPTVLDDRINLKVTTEASELSQTGTPFATVGGITAVLPSMTTRRVDTTVQLADGQSFAVAGLIKNNVTEALNKFPGLGEAPVVGALFRSTEFQNDRTELMFVVTPRLVKSVSGPIALPTDNHIVPSRANVILNGAGEGALPAPVPATESPAATPLAPMAPAPAR